MPTVTSPFTNSVTGFVKVIVTSKAPLCAPVGPLMVTVVFSGCHVSEAVTVIVKVAVTAVFTPSSAPMVTV